MQQIDQVQSDTAPQAAVEAAAEIAADIDALGAAGNGASADQSAHEGEVSPAIAGDYPSMAAGKDEKGGTTSQQVGRKQANTFLVIKELRSISRGRSLRLQPDDIIAAIDGKPFHDDIETFLDIMFECDQDHGVMLTVWRKGTLINVIARGPLGCVFEHAKQEASEAVARDFSAFQVDSQEHYATFEVLRDIFRNCAVLDTRLSPAAFIFPPLWAIQHRLWEVLLATSLIYGATLAVHWALFVVAYIILSVYLRRAHLVLRRSFGLMRGRHIWMVIAARSELEVQKLCRELDPKCIFMPDLVGPPETDPQPKKRRRRRS
ncbi:MAG: hypothetical protein CMM73_05070 [Rhodospirillaceae bacterium]|nr:hypothetical protein [Rhodospirillaceae bacterium]